VILKEVSQEFWTTVISSASPWHRSEILMATASVTSLRVLSGMMTAAAAGALYGCSS
jgi:ABC-type nitrate/sulfonate/bicarbonate transport system permease component